MKKPANMPESFPFESAVVIGGAGFIGSRIAADLREHYGTNVVVLDDGSRPNPFGEYRFGNAMDDDDVFNAIMEEDPKTCAVFHLAAKTDNSACMFERDLWLNRSAATLAYHTAGDNIGAFVFASSFAVYGALPYGTAAVEINNMERPITDYGRSKLIAEHALRVAFDLADGEVPIACLRLSNVIGRGNGRSADPALGLPAAIIRARASGEKVRVPFRDDSPTDPRYSMRDFIDVGDVSAAFIAAACAAKVERGYRTLNVCTGVATTVPALCWMAGVGVEESGSRAPHDAPWSCGDNLALKSFLSGVCRWAPEFPIHRSFEEVK